jgi:ABC-type uncharacterized transport system substrate-binding protein
VDRRETIRALLALAAATWSLTAAAQHEGPAHRIGVLAQDLQPELLDTFRDELGRLGYVVGRNVSIEVRNASGMSERLPALARDLLRLKVDVILAVNTPAARAAKEATKSVPIVIARVADPVKSGLVESLARPGGNVTGLSFMPDELGGKGIEILREVLPKISLMGHLYQGDNPGNRAVVDAVSKRGARSWVCKLCVFPSSSLKTTWVPSRPQRVLGSTGSLSWMMARSLNKDGKSSILRRNTRCRLLLSTRILRRPVPLSPTAPASAWVTGAPHTTSTKS